MAFSFFLSFSLMNSTEEEDEEEEKQNRQTIKRCLINVALES